MKSLVMALLALCATAAVVSPASAERHWHGRGDRIVVERNGIGGGTIATIIALGLIQQMAKQDTFVEPAPRRAPQREFAPLK